MIHYVYEIKNIIDEKIYIGKHSTENIDDGYMGSGKHLNRAIKKHGLEYFRKRILNQFKTAEEALEFEKQIVNEQFVKDEKTYNLCIGGCGGDIHLPNSDARKAMSNALRINWKNKNYRERARQRSSKIAIRLRLEGKWNSNNTWPGQKHTEETKKKIGATNSKIQTGKGNSQFGTMWISHLEEKRSQKIKKEDLEKFIELGWIQGRKMKW